MYHSPLTLNWALEYLQGAIMIHTMRNCLLYWTSVNTTWLWLHNVMCMQVSTHTTLAARKTCPRQVLMSCMSPLSCQLVCMTTTCLLVSSALLSNCLPASAVPGWLPNQLSSWHADGTSDCTFLFTSVGWWVDYLLVRIGTRTNRWQQQQQSTVITEWYRKPISYGFRVPQSDLDQQLFQHVQGHNFGNCACTTSRMIFSLAIGSLILSQLPWRLKESIYVAL